MPGSIRSSTTRSGHVAARRVERVATVGHRLDVEPFPLEVPHDDLADRRVVLDHEHVGHRPRSPRRHHRDRDEQRESGLGRPTIRVATPFATAEPRRADHEPREERQPDALDLGLRHAAHVGEQHRTPSRRPPARPAACAAGASARRRRPDRSRAPRRRGSRAGSSRTGGGPRRRRSTAPASPARPSHQANPVPAATASITAATVDARRSPSVATRRRCTATASGITARSTSPYERKAVAANARPPSTASASARRPVAAASRATSERDRGRAHAGEEGVAGGPPDRGGRQREERRRRPGHAPRRRHRAPRRASRPSRHRRRRTRGPRWVRGRRDRSAASSQSTTTMPGGWPCVWMLYEGRRSVKVAEERHRGRGCAGPCGCTAAGAADP